MRGWWRRRRYWAFGRRALIEGEYKLTAEDAIEGARFDDVIAVSPCAIIHYYGYRRYLEHDGYDIPYRCLVPQEDRWAADCGAVYFERAAAV